jgi:hypothetical protein
MGRTMPWCRIWPRGGHFLPGRRDSISGEVVTSLELAPGHRGGAEDGVTYDVYWRMRDADRSVR